MTCRIATVADVEQLVRIYADCFDRAWSGETLLACVQDDVVIVTGQPIAGFIVFKVALDEAEIVTLAVAPSARRKGIARSLLTDGFDRLRSENAKKIFLEVATDNMNAIGLYRQMGFKQIGQRKGYYTHADGSLSDAWVMACALDEAQIASNN